jgi:hypothetical protein
VKEEREFGLRFGIEGQQQLAAVGCRDMQIDHLHGGELFDGAARRQPRRQRVQPPAERDVETIGEEGDEDIADPLFAVQAAAAIGVPVRPA